MPDRPDEPDVVNALAEMIGREAARRLSEQGNNKNAVRVKEPDGEGNPRDGIMQDIRSECN
jgi:hypothetical protein